MLGITQTATRAPFGHFNMRPVDDGLVGKQPEWFVILRHVRLLYG